MIDLHSPCTQAQFAEIVNISQPKVSQLLTDGTIKAGDSLGVWLIDYVGNLREQAAGRGADGELAFQRSEFARVSRERAEIKLAVERGAFAPVGVLTQTLAMVVRSVASRLEAIPGRVHKRVPTVLPEVLAIIEEEIAAACNDAAQGGTHMFDDNEGETLDAIEGEPEEIGEGSL